MSSRGVLASVTISKAQLAAVLRSYKAVKPEAMADGRVVLRSGLSLSLRIVVSTVSENEMKVQVVTSSCACAS